MCFYCSIFRSPFVLREDAHPFRNLEYTGISGSRVLAMEERLKSDIIAESIKYGGHVLLHGEEGIVYLYI